MPLEKYIDHAREGIHTTGDWEIEREEDELTGGRVSYTTVWVLREQEDSRVRVRLDFRDGIVITGSEGLPQEDEGCVLRLNDATRAAIGLE